MLFRLVTFKETGSVLLVRLVSISATLFRLLSVAAAQMKAIPFSSSFSSSVFHWRNSIRSYLFPFQLEPGWHPLLFALLNIMLHSFSLVGGGVREVKGVVVGVEQKNQRNIQQIFQPFFLKYAIVSFLLAED
jgi:hypothetical protein